MRSRILLPTLALVAGATLALPLPAADATVSPARVRPLPTHVNDCWSTDNGDPVVDSFAASPAVVDSDAGPTTVHLTASAHDTGGPGPANGVRAVSVHLVPQDVPSGQYVPELETELRRGPDGAWHGTVTVPAHTDQTYSASLEATDRVPRSTLTRPNGASRTFPDALQVTGTTVPASDTTAPELTGLRLSRTEVDTRRRARSITVTATATDDQSGVRQVSVGFLALGRSGRLGRPTVTLQRVPATDRYRGHVPFARWTGNHHEAISAGVVDNAGNALRLRSWNLAKRGLPSEVTVVSGPLNTRGPTVEKVLRAPRAVDLRRHGRWYPVRVVVADPQGVAAVGVRLRSLRSHAELHRVSGSARRGVWAGRTHVRRCVDAAGSTTLAIHAQDEQGRINGARSVRSVRVLSPDHVPPTARGRWRTSPHVFTFSEPVHGISSENVQVYDDNTATGPDPLPGSWRCHGRTGHRVSCLTGSVYRATFVPDDPHAANPGVVDWEPEHHLGVLDAHGNPFDGESLSPDVID